MKTITPLSKIYKELGIDFTFPIEIKNEYGKETYYEKSSGYWSRREYGENGKVTYYEKSDGFWARYEYDENSNQTYYEDNNGFWYRFEYGENGKVTYYYEDSNGDEKGTKKSSCDGKVIEVDGKKYKLTEL